MDHLNPKVEDGRFLGTDRGLFYADLPRVMRGFPICTHCVDEASLTHSAAHSYQLHPVCPWGPSDSSPLLLGEKMSYLVPSEGI